MKIPNFFFFFETFRRGVGRGGIKEKGKEGCSPPPRTEKPRNLVERTKETCLGLGLGVKGKTGYGKGKTPNPPTFFILMKGGEGLFSGGGIGSTGI